jgi:hypothetical protein
VAASAADVATNTFKGDTFRGLNGTQLDAAGAVKGSCISWVPGEEVGQGTLGTVFKALDQRSGQIFAVKEVRIDPHLTEEQRFKNELQNEIEMLRDLKHPNIVSYLGHDEINSRLYIYLEYMPGGSVAHVLSQFGPFDESLIASRGRGLLAGLEYLHTSEPVCCTGTSRERTSSSAWTVSSSSQTSAARSGPKTPCRGPARAPCPGWRPRSSCRTASAEGATSGASAA